MCKKIKSAIIWNISIISTFFIAKLFARHKSLTDEYRRSANEISTEPSRNNDLSNAAKEKVENINNRIERSEKRSQYIENGLNINKKIHVLDVILNLVLTKI